MLLKIFSKLLGKILEIWHLLVEHLHLLESHYCLALA